MKFSILYVFVFQFFISFPGDLNAQRCCRQHHAHHSLRGGSPLDHGALRSDTLDILLYDIYLDMTLMTQQYIKASCKVDVRSRMDNVSFINLDLQSLVVDSIKAGGNHLNFQHTGSNISIAFPQSLSNDEEYSLTVYYKGNPAADPTWGGFYFSLGYGFNLGVGFESNPHNFGRAWFPCFDNFVERSAYQFHVLTANGRKAYCSGLRTGVDNVGQDSLLTHWQLQEPIPTYLAGVAVANYTHVTQSFESVTGEQIPIWLTALPADTAAMKQSMANLIPCLHGFEEHYGNYRWPRVGYSVVPFNGGAMEHATNIAYPRFAINGTLAYETLMAHELSHHWWGNLVTCRTAGDMWINEGWASFSEALFLEHMYGSNAYKEQVKNNHKEVMRYAHRRDGARYAISPIPHEITYGDHVYNKGADVAHTLRGYMGDEAFFTAIEDFMDQHAFTDVSSEDLRDFFQNYTTADLTSFFQNWVFSAGFPEFRIAQVQSLPGNAYVLRIDQYLHYAPEYYSNVPMQITAVNQAGDKVFFQTMLSGEQTTVEITLPALFEPMAFYLNEDEAISQAVLAQERVITSVGSNHLDFAEMSLQAETLGSASSIFVRVENHWAAADQSVPQPEFYISPDRWWNVITNAPADATLKATIRYYGNTQQLNFYDSLFFKHIADLGWNEDSLKLVYRPDASSPWQIYPDYTLSTTPGLTNWIGRFEISKLRQGHYAWALNTGATSVEFHMSKNDFVAYISSNALVVETNHTKGQLSIYDASGKLKESRKVDHQMMIDVSSWSKGIYHLRWLSADSKMCHQKIVVE